jgi:hypothetical protein
MARSVIAVYKPRAGKQGDLEALVAKHWPALRARSLVTDRRPLIMRAADGTIVEVFEWLSREAIEQAHHDPIVQALWAEFGKACELMPIGAVPEAGTMFSEFVAIAP